MLRFLLHGGSQRMRELFLHGDLGGSTMYRIAEQTAVLGKDAPFQCLQVVKAVLEVAKIAALSRL